MLSSKSKFGCIIQSWSKLCSVRRLLSNTTFETHFGFESVGEIRKQEKGNRTSIYNYLTFKNSKLNLESNFQI